MHKRVRVHPLVRSIIRVTRRPARLIVLSILIACPFYSAAIAQTSSDSAAVAGSTAALNGSLGPYPTFAAIGGIVFGFFGVSLLTSDLETWRPAATWAAGGIAAAGLASILRAPPLPDSLRQSIVLRDSAYAAAYSDAYVQTLQRRRLKAVAKSATLGTLGGLLGLFLLLRD